MTYLVDAYNRFRLQRRQNYLRAKRESYSKELSDDILTKKQLRKLIKFERQKLGDLSIEKFIKKKCVIFRECPIFEEMCIESMKCLINPKSLSRPHIKCQSLYRFDDNIMDFAHYIFESYSVISTYINNLNYSQMPSQFDLMIIPKRVRFDDGGSGEYVVMTECESNIKQLLQDAHCKFVEQQFGCYPNSNQIARLMSKFNKLAKNKKPQRCDVCMYVLFFLYIYYIFRCCMVIDRRDYNDKMFVYQTGNDSDAIHLNKNEFVNESLFN